MKIAVFGATQGVGREVVNQALAQNNTINVLARSPNKLAALKNSNLKVIQGNVLQVEDVVTTLRGVNVVVISLGPTKDNPANIVSQGTQIIIEAMQDQQISRLIVVTSLGIGDSKEQVPLIFKLLIKTVLRKVMADKEIQEKFVRDSGLNWTIVRPGGLTEKPSTGQYRLGTHSDIIAGQISRSDVASFILQELEGSNFLHLAVAIT